MKSPATSVATSSTESRSRRARSGQPSYATADQIASIEEGVVQLTLTREEFARLERYLQPASSLEIEPDDHHGAAEAIEAEARKIAGGVLEPTGRRERPFNLMTRVAHLLRGKRSRY
jgi:hypothetical protein